jgi:hypothetical protein
VKAASDFVNWTRLLSPRCAALALLLMGLCERLVLWLAYQPVEFGDTPSYARLGKVLIKSGLSGYDGTRVPGYPAWLALFSFDFRAVWASQMVLGLAISLMLFWITWRLSSHVGLSLMVGLLYDLSAGQVLFEADILSESLTAFLLVAVLALLLVLSRQEGLLNGIVISFALGLTASLAGMVRTLYFFLPVLLVPFLLFFRRDSYKDRLARLIAFSLPPALIFGAWIAFIDIHYHMLSPTTMGGYHMIQHTGQFFQYLPDEDAVIRDTYLKYRDAAIAARGVQTNAIWDAIPELSQKTGLSFFALSSRLGQLSMLLIRQHPDLYLKSVVSGWIDFWKAPVYWKADSFQTASLAQLAGVWVWITRMATLSANALFLLLSGMAVISRQFRRAIGLDAFMAMAGGTIWMSSIVQTLADHGDNPRFLVPLQAVLFWVVGVAAGRLARQPVLGRSEHHA